MARKKQSRQRPRQKHQRTRRALAPAEHSHPPLIRALDRILLWPLWSLAIGMGFLVAGTFNQNPDGSLGFGGPGLFFSAFGIAAPCGIFLLSWAFDTFWGDDHGGWRRGMFASEIALRVLATSAFVSMSLFLFLIPVAALTEVIPDFFGAFDPYAWGILIGLFILGPTLGAAAGAVVVAGWRASPLGLACGGMFLGWGLSAVSNDPAWPLLGLVCTVIYVGGMFGAGMPYLLGTGTVGFLGAMWALAPLGVVAFLVGWRLDYSALWLTGVMAFSAWLGFFIWWLRSR